MRTMLVVGLAVLLVAGCGSSLLAPECDTNPLFAGSALTCESAVGAALQALPTDHSPIERIQFLYGSATPTIGGLFYAEGAEQPVSGYVVFTYADGADRQYVPVVWFDEKLSSGTPAPY